MKKLFISFFALMFTMLTYAQIPSSMMYQVMVTTGSTTPQDVKIGMALYTTSDGTTPVWSKDYSFTNVADKTIENLELDFSTVNLSSGAFWLATSINDTEVGRVKLTPVPFACVAKVVEGGPNKNNIIGTWYFEDTVKGYHSTIVFKKDGTFQFTEHRSSDKYYEGTYKVLANGIIYSVLPGSDEEVHCDEVALISDTQLMMMSDGGRFGKMELYNKQ